MFSKCPALSTRVVLLLAALFLAALPLDAQETGEKKAVPDATAIGKAEALITRLFAARLKEAKTDKAKAQALAAELLAQGKTTNDDDALQFVALKLASEVAAAAGDNAAALQAIEVLSKTFQVDTLAMKSTVYAQAEKGITAKDAAGELIEAVLVLVEEAVQTDNFAVADQLLATADRAVLKCGKLALATRVEKQVKEVAEARKAFDAIKPLLGKAGKELEVGKYYCFTKGNYAKGLPLLAKSKDAHLKALAERDLANPKEPKKQAQLADDWYKLGEEQKGLAQRQTYRRALHWYQTALPKLEGLTRVRIGKVVEELAKLFPAAGAPVVTAEITKEVRAIPNAHASGIYAVAISGDGKWLLSGGIDNGVRLWDAATGQKLKDFAVQNIGCNGLAISADKKWALVAGTDMTLRLLNLETGQEERRFNGHNQAVRAVHFLADGKRIISACDDGNIRIFDFATGNVLKTMPAHTQFFTGLAVSKDGKRAVSGSSDLSVKVWDLEKGVEVHKFMHGRLVQHIALTPDGKYAVSASYDNTVKVWDCDAGKEVRKLEHPCMVWHVAISPDGRRVYTGCGGGLPVNDVVQASDKFNQIRVFDLPSGKELRTLEGHGNHVMSLGLSADGRWLVSGSHDNTVRLWGVK